MCKDIIYGRIYGVKFESGAFQTYTSLEKPLQHQSIRESSTSDAGPRFVSLPTFCYPNSNSFILQSTLSECT